MEIDWQAVGSFVAGLFSGGGLVKLATSWVQSWTTNRNKRAVEDIVHIYEAMQDIVSNTDIQRVLVMATHNDGQEIKPGSKLYTSVAYEQVSHPFQSVKALYQNIPLDSDYVSILLEILNKGKKAYHVKNMSTGLLKTIYDTEGVAYAEIYYLADSHRKKIWYLSCATSKPVTFLPGGQQILIARRVDEISRILTKHN